MTHSFGKPDAALLKEGQIIRLHPLTFEISRNRNGEACEENDGISVARDEYGYIYRAVNNKDKSKAYVLREHYPSDIVQRDDENYPFIKIINSDEKIKKRHERIYKKESSQLQGKAKWLKDTEILHRQYRFLKPVAYGFIEPDQGPTLKKDFFSAFYVVWELPSFKPVEGSGWGQEEDIVTLRRYVERASESDRANALLEDGFLEKLRRNLLQSFRALHEQKVDRQRPDLNLHLALNPDNILVDASGNAFIYSFGLNTWPGSRFERYAAPEFIEDPLPEDFFPSSTAPEFEPPDKMADLYSIGAVLSFVATQQDPISSWDRYKRLKTRKRDVIQEELDQDMECTNPGLDAIKGQIKTLMDRDPARRLQVLDSLDFQNFARLDDPENFRFIYLSAQKILTLRRTANWIWIWDREEQRFTTRIKQGQTIRDMFLLNDSILVSWSIRSISIQCIDEIEAASDDESASQSVEVDLAGGEGKEKSKVIDCKPLTDSEFVYVTDSGVFKEKVAKDGTIVGKRVQLKDAPDHQMSYLSVAPKSGVQLKDANGLLHMWDCEGNRVSEEQVNREESDERIPTVAVTYHAPNGQSANLEVAKYVVAVKLFCEIAQEFGICEDLVPRVSVASWSADSAMVGASYQDAQDFCQALSQKTGESWRLPTSDEMNRILKSLGDVFAEDTTPAEGSNRASHFFLEPGRRNLPPLFPPETGQGNLDWWQYCSRDEGEVGAAQDGGSEPRDFQLVRCVGAERLNGTPVEYLEINPRVRYLSNTIRPVRVRKS